MKINPFSQRNLVIGFVVVISIILIVSLFRLPTGEGLSPGDVKLTKLTPCLLNNNMLTPTSNFRTADTVSICAQLDSKSPLTELYYYLLSEHLQTPIYSDADEYPNGKIRIEIPFYLDPGEYKFEIRWGRQILGTVMFIVD